MTNRNPSPVFIGNTQLQGSQQPVTGEYVSILGEVFYKISHYDAMDPFFMSIVSSSNHWLFIASTGGLTAGRVSAEQALFPYYTVDKLTENSENTGRKAILLVTREQRTSLWEPFSNCYQGIYQIERSIFKNISGSVVVFEETNYSLGLTYRYAWRTSDRFGFVVTSWLQNAGQANCRIELLDGLHNILPANINAAAQNRLSTLLDAYKRSELNAATGLAIFTLNSILTDLAEPSESLLASTVLQLGLEAQDYLLASDQLDNFRAGLGLTPETEICGKRCAYFVHAAFDLPTSQQRTWYLVADVSQDSAAIVHLSNRLKQDHAALIRELESDMAINTRNLEKIVAGADGLQLSNQQLRTSNHFANVLFNVMRGGVFEDQYEVDKQEFIDFVVFRNRKVLDQNLNFFAELPLKINIADLQVRAEESGIADLIRMSYAYLPLSFSRRHGDPSRPWNRFAINLKKENGSRRLDYEGNWRDIFQNWEALATSYPEYIESMVCTFLNATTPDGYNPYRITLHGIEWEYPEPDNPWANIGYWSDHQIIYLQKLMEISARVHPGRLQTFLTKPIFSYANVPYRIKPYQDLLQDPFNTIEFDWEKDRETGKRVQAFGTDGKLVFNGGGQPLQVAMGEKLLTLLLAKLVNFVPEGGIWMNTQRPEWNDANNALVGKGLSVVTLAYLRRTIVFFKDLLQQSGLQSLQINVEVQQLYVRIAQVLHNFQGGLKNRFSNHQRRAMMDALGNAGSDYRIHVYENGLKDESAPLVLADLMTFLDLAQQYIEHTLRANQRSDKLYHAYNILNLDGNQASISHLYEMLEGQVAILSSGLLSAEESLELLESLRRSPLYVADCNSYILYPDRHVPGFLEKNSITLAQVQDLALVSALVKAQDQTLIKQDEDGSYHFNGSIRNGKDVTRTLAALANEPRFAHLIAADGDKIEALYEEIFRHNQFTGRSGTFFAYEGLGSIYWHMVSKLLLAVQETILLHKNEPASRALIEKYRDIQQGQSPYKTPQEYGAFPTDPYSHTPKGQGAKQPGLTGMVKEDILTRQAELGVRIENGRLIFDFLLLNQQEFLTQSAEFAYWDVNGYQQHINLNPGSLAYSICQVPVILQTGSGDNIIVYLTDGSTQHISGHTLDLTTSTQIFQREGIVHHLLVEISPDH